MNGIVTGKIETTGGKVPTSAVRQHYNGNATITDIDKYLVIATETYRSYYTTYCVIFPQEKYAVVVNSSSGYESGVVYKQSVITLNGIGNSSVATLTINFNTNTITTNEYSDLGFELFS